jgi:hypothetical protein
MYHIRPIASSLFIIIGIAVLPVMSDAATYYVDGNSGNDANPGTNAKPWKTLTKASAFAGSLKPGDAVLLKRGSAWDGEQLEIMEVAGTEKNPITFGAYGPETAPRPSIGNGRVYVKKSEHIIIRDMEVHHSPQGPCISVSRSGYLTVVNNVVHHAKSNGIAYHAGVHHTATVDNIVHDVLANDGISIHDAQWGDNPGPVGSHHWVIDNLLPGNYREDAIDVATEDAESAPAGQDIKIIGNRIYGARLAGIVSQHQCRYTWVLGNTIMGCGYAGAKAISLGKATGDGLVKASGNLLIDNPRCVRLRDQAEFRNNTIIHRDNSEAFLLYANADQMILERNLVLTAGVAWVQVQDDLPDIHRIRLDWNWYGGLHKSGPKTAGAFLYKSAHTLEQWQGTLGQDQHSVIGQTVRLYIDDPMPVDVFQWNDDFFARFIPEENWRGHTMDGRGVGAFGPDGTRLGMEITPFPGYDVNDGYGWPGPEIVRKRYPLRQ